MMLDVTFELGTNLDTAQVLVQNRVAVAEAETAGRGEADWCDDEEEIAQHPDVRQLDLAGRPLRPALPQQLCLAERQRRSGPRPGRGGRRVSGSARLQHADLARPEQTGVARDDRQRRDPGDQGTERAGRGRPDRPAAGAGRIECSVSAAAKRARPPLRCESNSRTSSSNEARRARSSTCATWFARRPTTNRAA